MVIGWLKQEAEQAQAAGSAWARVEAAQRQHRLPCLLIPQPAHAVLAGELAACLNCFGELPSEIQRAIQMHDTGWAAGDAQQIQRLRSPEGASHSVPVSFVAIPAAEAEQAWTASIHAVEAFSSAGAVVISRHFTLLAQHDQRRHQRFLQVEKSRQQKLGGPPADLDRWTAALGFSDLVSLYLLSGLSREVELPLAHPASPQAKTAPRVTMRVDGANLRFTPQITLAGCVLSIQGLRHPIPSHGPRAETLTWKVQ
ncbi:MAG TPA: DUF3891 family protein [Acidobacteriaceae bacterium]|nr:DUF3891 family protein [Acidobacteriaceae bacterium]